MSKLSLRQEKYLRCSGTESTHLFNSESSSETTFWAHCGSDRNLDILTEYCAASIRGYPVFTRVWGSTYNTAQRVRVHSSEAQDGAVEMSCGRLVGWLMEGKVAVFVDDPVIIIARLRKVHVEAANELERVLLYSL